MTRLTPRTLLLALSAATVIVAVAQQPEGQKEPTAEQVYKNIQVFKGLPASEISPVMEFMSASLNYTCTDCHDAKDYSIETRAKETARHMVTMQRDINTKNFNGRNEVTCFTCHGGKEHPAGTPLPEGVALRHPRMSNAPKPADLFAKNSTAMGKFVAPIVRVGTLTAPNDATHKLETLPLTFTQGADGKFVFVSGDRRIGSNGKATYYGAYPMSGDPAAMFNRIGKTWLGAASFSGMGDFASSGQDMVGKSSVVAVRATQAPDSHEILFDAKPGLIARVVAMHRTNLGTVVSSIDYSNYKSVGGVKVPMHMVIHYGGGETWVMDFKTVKLDATIKDAIFEVPTSK